MRQRIGEAELPQLHHVDSTHVVYEYDKNCGPAVRVHSGDVVVLECEDSNHGVIQTPEDGPSKVDFDRLCPATGPIYVEGADPGDVLAVHILRIEVGDQGSAMQIPGGWGFLKHEMGPFTRIVTVRDGFAIFRDDVLIPTRPSMGTFGVAPAGEPVLTLYPSDNGANMDHKDVCAGNTVYMPVFVPGALLSMGDAHAVIGDGESSGEALEVPSVATIQVEVHQGTSLPRPIIESPDEIMTCGWGMTMEEATTCAMSDMVDFLERKLGMPRSEAYSLLGMVGDVRPGNAVTSPGAMRFVVPKGIFTRGITVL